MIEHFTSETFRDRIGERFRMRPGQVPDVEFEVELTECAESVDGDPARRAEGMRVPFSIVFLAAGAEVVPQQICHLEHPELGAFELFLVPLGPDRRRGGMRYEAVFG